MFGVRNLAMFIIGRQLNIPHVGGAVGLKKVRGSVTEEVAPQKVLFLVKAGELLDRIGNRPEPAAHVPLIGQKPRQPPRPYGRRIRKRESNYGPRPARQGVRDFASVLILPGQRIPNGGPGESVAGELIQHFDGLHSTLTVADDHGSQPFSLVIPGNEPGDLVAAFIATESVGAVSGIADAGFG